VQGLKLKVRDTGFGASGFRVEGSRVKVDGLW